MSEMALDWVPPFHARFSPLGESLWRQAPVLAISSAYLVALAAREALHFKAT
jgi:hypothetical protein